MILAAIVLSIPLVSPTWLTFKEKTRLAEVKKPRLQAEFEPVAAGETGNKINPLNGITVEIDELDSRTIEFLRANPDRANFNQDGTVTLWKTDQRRSAKIKKLEAAIKEAELNAEETSSIAEKTGLVRSRLMDVVFSVATTILYVLATAILPLILLLGLWIASAGRAMASISEGGHVIPEGSVFTTENWPRLIDRLRASPDPVEQESLLFGVNEFDGSPILIPRSALREHVHFLGATGSGKTALGLSPLISQLLDFEDSSVVVVDLKGDDQVLLEEIKKSQRPRKHLTTDMGKGTFGFNLFAQKFWQTLSVANKADLICTGLGLYYGTDYGRSYYSGVNFSLIEAALLKNPEASSFREIYETVCSLKLPGQNISDAAGARIALRRLAQHDILNMGSSLDSNTDLDFESLFQSPEAWFVSLPTSIGSSVNPDIGRLICFSMLAAAKHAQKPRKQVYLVIDEFQRIVSSNLEIILQLARSHEISVILANQSLGDLDTPGSNLLATLATNTRLRQCFSIGDEREMGSVMRAAGEYLIKDTRFNQGSFGLVGSTIQSLSNSFVPSSRLRVNDILAASDSPGSSIFNLRAGAGYAQYGGMSFVAHSVHHIPESEYRRRLNATWPGPDESPYAAQESCVKVEKDAKSVDPVPLPTKEAVQKTATQADADQLQEMFSKLDGGREKNE